MITRGQNFKSVPLNIVGSSTFGRYPKISAEKTYNMFISDTFMVPYAGYEIAIANLGSRGRGIFAASQLGEMIVIVDNIVYVATITFNQNLLLVSSSHFTQIGTLLTSGGTVYFAENNKPQVLISDSVSLYLYDRTLTPAFQIVPNLNFRPGYIDFHDTYFLCAASSDQTYDPPANNTWRLSAQNDGMSWPSVAQNVGLLQTKPDSTQAVVRFPSHGNLIVVMGEIVTEFWFDTGAQLFPYQRNNSYSIDYGCLNPATVAANDEIIVWLAANEKSGPVIMFAAGTQGEKITTDGIDYLLSTLQSPQDARAFMYRQDGHLIYHINFFTDNLSLFYDFNTKKFYHACDENLNYFIAEQVAFFQNQYYFISRNNGNVYAFDTAITTFAGQEIPRGRICKNIRFQDQCYRIINDIGFTIESGETNYIYLNERPIFLVTMNGDYLVTQGQDLFLTTVNGNFLVTMNGDYLIATQQDLSVPNKLVTTQDAQVPTTPRVDLSISYNGGATFGSDYAYNLPAIGQRKNRLMWWNIGIANDCVAQFKFWGIGRFVVTDGEVNVRQ